VNQTPEQVIIIGGGPAGYTAALYTARANLDPLVLEGFAWGGLLQQTTDVENYPGYPEGVMGPEMMQQFRDQAARFGARLETDDATKVELASDGGVHRVWLGDELHEARTVILAMGAQHRKLGVPGELDLSGRGVSYCATCDAAFFKGAETLIIGGGDSAMEEAMFLSKFAGKVGIVHRRDEFRASKIMLERARAIPNIEWLTPYVVEELHRAENGALGRARLRNTVDGSERDLPARSSRSDTSPSRSSSRGRSKSIPPATSSPKASPHARIFPGSSPPAISSITPIVRRSRPPAQAVRRHSTPSGICVIHRL